MRNNFTDQLNQGIQLDKQNVIFQDQDYQKIKKAQRKLYIAPLKSMGIFASLVLGFRYLVSKQIFPNPLARPTQQSNQSKISSVIKGKGKLVFFHTMVFLGIATFIGAFFAKQIHTFQLYTRYQRQVAFYMRWKMVNQVQKQNQNR